MTADPGSTLHQIRGMANFLSSFTGARNQSVVLFWNLGCFPFPFVETFFFFFLLAVLFASQLASI